jgi:hypothetical protein
MPRSTSSDDGPSDFLDVLLGGCFFAMKDDLFNPAPSLFCYGSSGLVSITSQIPRPLETANKTRTKIADDRRTVEP